MSKKIFYFGEEVKGYNVRVFNEREIRAAAGILFLFAFIAFMNAWLVGNFNVIKIFVIAFFIDFSIRVFINPKFSPSMIAGRFFVQNQRVEYAGAPQKKFAWILGLILSGTMFFLVVVNDIRGPINLGICVLCLTFLFFESVFGICIGCKLYNLMNKEKAQYCQGGGCEIKIKAPIQKISPSQIIILLIFLALIVFLAFHFLSDTNTLTSASSTIKDTCLIIPEWVKEIGHEETYLLHMGCN